jgi:hypothetical protein
VISSSGAASAGLLPAAEAAEVDTEAAEEARWRVASKGDFMIECKEGIDIASEIVLLLSLRL